MTNNENQYTIYIRSTKESIPVSKEEFDAYYHDINIYRIRYGRYLAVQSEWRLKLDTVFYDCWNLSEYHTILSVRKYDLFCENTGKEKVEPGLRHFRHGVCQNAGRRYSQ